MNPTPHNDFPTRKAGDYSDNEMLERLSRVIPRSLLDGIVASMEQIEEGERRPISILFSDLCGFTALTEEIGDEAVSDLIDEIYTGIRGVVAKYDGNVEKFIGDAVMAVFGAPKAHGDDPERAIRAAFDIHEMVRLIGAAHGYSLDTHSGIAFGEVVFKTIRGEGRLDFRTIGDAVNIASRLQELATPGEILVDHRIYQQTFTTFEWKHRKPVTIRGKKKPIQTYRATAIRKQFSKVALGERIRMSPLIGRKGQIERLKKSIDLMDEGKFQVIHISGEPGVGKSRLVYELYHQLPQNRYHWFTGRCLSFGKHMPFMPIIDLLRAMLKLPSSLESTIELKELRDAVETLFTPVRQRMRTQSKKKSLEKMQHDLVDALAFLFSIPYDTNPLLKLTPRRRRKSLFHNLMNGFAHLSLEKPVILVCEDFHWADEDSLELLDCFIENYEDAPIMIIILSRPDLDYRFPKEDTFVRMYLKELPSRESAQLLRNLLGLERFPGKLRDKILEKTEGNPFFIEEVVLNLETEGFLKRKGEKYLLTTPIETIRIPDTVEGVVLARFDRLEKNIKSVLQCASVIGQEFQYNTLSHVMELGKRLGTHLIDLVSDDYLLQKTLLPELIYIFRHVVLRDVAYGTLLEKRRRHFHGRIAETIEEIFPDKLEEYFELLAHHYEKGNVTEKALYYLEKAAKKCENLYAQYAAADHWERLLALSEKEKVSTRERQMLRLNANLRLGELYRRLGKPEHGINVYKSAKAIAMSLKDTQRAIHALRGLSEAYRLTGDTEKGLESIREAFRRARRIDNKELIASCQNYIGHFEKSRGNFSKARTAFNAVLQFATQTHDRQRRYQALNHLGIINMVTGKKREANECYYEALELARELGMKNEQAVIELNIGLNHLRLCECDKAKEKLLAAASDAEKIEFERGVQLALLALIDLDLRMGNVKDAASRLTHIFKRMEDACFSDVRDIAINNQARAFLAMGKLDRAETNVEKTLHTDAPEENYFGYIDALGILTEIYLERKTNTKALATAQNMLSIAQKNQDEDYISIAQNLIARALLGLKRPSDAKKFAQQAVRSARRATLPRDEGWAQLTLGLCEKKPGNNANAEKYLAAAARKGKTCRDATLTSLVHQQRSDL